MFIKEEVFQLKVFVSIAFLMDVVDGDNELVRVEARHLLAKATTLLEVVEHLAAWGELTDDYTDTALLLAALLAQNCAFFVVD